MYRNEGKNIFMTFSLSPVWLILGTTIWLLLGALVGYRTGVRWYTSEIYETSTQNMILFAQQRYDYLEGDVNIKELGSATETMIEGMADLKIKSKLESDKKKLESSNTEEVKKELEALEAEYETYLEKKGRKWITMISLGVVFGLIGFFGTMKFLTIF
jgi:phage pi2 protein 07